LVGVKLKLGLGSLAADSPAPRAVSKALAAGLADFNPVKQQAKLAFQTLGILNIRIILGVQLANQLFRLGQVPIAKPFLGVEEASTCGLNWRIARRT